MTGAVTVLATVVVGVRTPYAPGSYGVCPSVLLFGVYCPACGGLRAVHELAHLDLAGAMAMNPLLVLGLPVLVAAWGLWLLRSLGVWTGPVRVPGWTGWVTLAVLLLYAVVRNLPPFAWLAPGG
ncbi:DUF2752 domain-containing protein [Cellulomonas sp. KRMCY2]|uniref:DUF2752 domain-containing protein n=1 Tax=Cellulomonas sp. KRMCY2 TaxID=1304865 RepID=UPI001E3ED756|nr:DUF2752 domain-containing protein [Cellulomonas sp. KRMCY2]